MSLTTYPRVLTLLLFVAAASPVFAESPSLSSLGKPQQLTSPEQVPEGLQKSDMPTVNSPLNPHAAPDNARQREQAN